MISAVVVNWNGKHYLESCIDALLAQEPPPDELILADNHSDDGSREFCAERYPQVRVLDTGRNGGPGLARNAGVEAAEHDVVLLVDNDVVVEPGALASMSATLEGDPKCAVVQARSLCQDDRDVVHYDSADVHYLGLLLLHNFYVKTGEATRPAGPVGAIVSLCMLVRRDPYRAVGGFNERLFILFEDTDLSLKLRARGHVLRLDADALCIHGGGTAGISMRAGAALPARRAYLTSRNRWLVLWTCMRWRTFAITLPMHLLYAFVHFLFALGRGQPFAWLRGAFAAFAMLPQVPGWRRIAQAERVVSDRELFVAAPLTLNPGIGKRGVAGWLRDLLDDVYRGYWRGLRWLCG